MKRPDDPYDDYGPQDIDDRAADGEDWNGWGAAILDRLGNPKKEKRNMTTTQTKQPGKVAKNAASQVMTPEFRASFPAVFAPRGMEGQEPKYSVVMLFPKSADLSKMKMAVKSAIIDKWGPDQAKWPKKLKLPFRDGSEKDYDGYGPDVVFVTATSKMKPGLVNQAVQPIIDPTEFQGGDYARATVSAFAYDRAGNVGVAFGLRNIQKVRDGERFSGASKPENDFDAIDTPAAGNAAAGEDPLAGIGA